LVTGLLIGVINTGFIGHYGTANEVAGAGMANMISNIVVFSVVIGLSTALSTLASQAIGQEEYKTCGLYLNRSRVLMVIAFFILIIPLQMTGMFFELIGLDERSALFA
jgi:Na+-driven multidrug efflux pump